MNKVRKYASFLYSFFKNYKKECIAIICTVLAVISSFTIWNQVQMKHIVDNIREIMDKKDIKEGLFYIKGSRVYLVDNENKKFVDTLPLLGWVNGYLHITEEKEMVRMWNHGIITFKNYNQKNNKISLLFSHPNVTYNTIGTEQVYIVPETGTYKIELWGARGGESTAFLDTSVTHGKGAYTSGEIRLKKGTKLYLQVGSRGENGEKIKDSLRFTAFGFPSAGGKGGYNGGGDAMDDSEMNAGGGGGGATDVRLVSGKWDDFDSLKSRIMVAAGGGGMSRLYGYTGSSYAGTGASGSGGTITGKNGKVELIHLKPYGFGSTQTEGYKFGIGDNGIWCLTTLNGLGGGAGGYMGSYSGACNDTAWYPPTGAGGASSYVSGCDGCRAIKEDASEDNLSFEKGGIHYSGMKFSDIVMIDGDSKMPDPKNSKKEITGNDDDGYARITKVGW